MSATSHGPQKARIAFKRMETDEELVERILKATGAKVLSWSSGEALDELAWEQGKLLRRIVEDEA